MIAALFTIWASGFILVLCVQCSYRGLASWVSLREAGQIIGLAAVWPVLLVIGLVCLIADGLHFAFNVLRKPH